METKNQSLKICRFDETNCIRCEFELDIEDLFFENWCDKCCFTQGYDLQIYDWGNIIL